MRMASIPTMLLPLSWVLLTTAPLVHAETPGEVCDRLATHPFDPARSAIAEGVATGSIDIAPAIAACTAAAEGDPGTPRYRYQLGRAQFEKEDYQAAFASFAAASDKGYAAAKGALGYLYDEGYGTVVDKAKSHTLWSEAAEANVAFAAQNLGISYREGDGVAIDHAAALKLFQKAYDLGYTQSAVDIGFAYDGGNGVKQDYVEAMRWYQIAAKHDIVEAQNNIGSLYESGHGVPQNYALAHEWYEKASAQDYALADMNLAEMTDKGLGVPADAAKAAGLVLSAFEKGNAGDDEENTKDLFDRQWSPAFWTSLQERLRQSGHFSAETSGKPDEATKTAIAALLKP
ncbi:tetratricopeptide repeat protein [Rhizobium sp. LjRoot30]|uniref:tetratricopeptide repeat protein n=1 Tax=Rhizobium sp. LjRoot30 TaxID=3342320 RepID=UPI003ECED98A